MMTFQQHMCQAVKILLSVCYYSINTKGKWVDKIEWKDATVPKLAWIGVQIIYNELILLSIFGKCHAGRLQLIIIRHQDVKCLDLKFFLESNFDPIPHESYRRYRA